jgi:hypothetical protein
MRTRSLLNRRPSPAIVIASAALFVSLGGVGYAAVSLPAGSVGNAQLRNNAVSYQKIRKNSIGWQRANLTTLQERVVGTCASGSAVASIGEHGTVACNTSAPSEFGTTDNTATVTTTATPVTTESLPTGASYLAFANPTATVTSGATAQRLTVTCTLTVGSNTETRAMTLRTDGNSGDQTHATLPLQSTGQSGTSSVSCLSSAAAPAVSVTSGLSAIQIAS